jgi:SAM-dependent methyltransferase
LKNLDNNARQAFEFHENRLVNGLSNVSGNTAKSFNNFIFDEIMQLGISNEIVIDIGCGYGGLARTLISCSKDIRVFGIEFDEIKASVALLFCESVFVGDVTNMIKSDLQLQDLLFKADIIVLGDILEHLHDPWQFLRDISEFLKVGSSLIISVPCITSLASVKELLSGQFPYDNNGIFDFTHLRFFGPSDVLALAKASLQRFKLEKVIPNYCPSSLQLLHKLSHNNSTIEISPGVHFSVCMEGHSFYDSHLAIRGIILRCRKHD